MKNLEEIRKNYDIVTDKDASITDRLTLLAQSGLFEEKKLPLIKRAMEKDPAELTIAERRATLDLLDSLIAEAFISNDVEELNEAPVNVQRDFLTKLDTRQAKDFKERDIPYIIILKRKGIRYFTDNQKIGLYYSQQIDRYVSIPFNNNKGGHFGPGIMAEEMNTIHLTEKRNKSNNSVSKTRPFDLMGKLTARERELSAKPVSTMSRTDNVEVDKLAVKRALNHAVGGDPGGAAGAIGFLFRNRAKLNKAKKAAKDGEVLPALPKPDTKQITQRKDDITDVDYKVVNEPRVGNERQKALPAPAKKEPETITAKPNNNTPPGTRQKWKRRPYNAAAEAARQRLSGKDPTFPNINPHGPTNKNNHLAAKERRAEAKAAFKNKLAESRQQLDEILPFVIAAGAKLAAGAAARRAAGEIAKRAGSEVVKQGAKKALETATRGRIRNALGRSLRRKVSKTLGSDNKDGEKENNAPSSSPPEERNYLKKPDGKPIEVKIDKPNRIDTNDVINQRDRQQNRRMMQASVTNESVLVQLKNVSQKRLSEATITVDGNTVTINNIIANKILTVYESVNRQNKKKIDTMLNENVESFKKILNFAVRQ
jgi:hypothetical protein